MQRFGWRRAGVAFVFLACVAIAAAVVWRVGYRQALDQLTLRAEADLALASDRLTIQLQNYQELAVLMSDHPRLRQLQTDEAQAVGYAVLREVADKTGALDIMFADTLGRVVISAEDSAGQNVAGTAYFRRAMQGALGSGHGVTPVTDKRAYYYAAPAFGPGGDVLGVLIVAVDVEGVEGTWRGNNPAVLFTDASGRVFLSNRSELLFWSRREDAPGLLPPVGDPRPFSARMVGPHEIWHLGWGPYLPSEALHLERPLPVIDMVGEVLVDVAPARRLAGRQAAAIAALFLAFGAMLVVATERRRTLAQANARLEGRVAARTRALSEANARLREEVAERLEAEALLKRAQADLVQAGKLSALGQMSAGISHELNQPLMAIRQFAENGAAFLARGRTDNATENLSRIADMATRMARIIKNLRAFARNESEPMGKVDLVQVIHSATELTAARLRADHVDLDWDAARYPDPIHAWGGEVRLAQVFVNLINNAADAMLDQDHRAIRITIDAGPKLAVHVQDVGPGIEEPEKMFDPFYTTKAVGSAEGLGLGLSISYGLVQSFGGNIRGTNTADGAVFTVELEYHTVEKAA